jgi:hypothetical protein
MIDDEQFGLVALSTQKMVEHLHLLEGVGLPLVFAAMHGEIMAMVAAEYGGEKAAGLSRRAGDTLEGKAVDPAQNH